MVPECVSARRRCTCGRTGCPDACPSPYSYDDYVPTGMISKTSDKDAKTYEKRR